MTTDPKIVQHIDHRTKTDHLTDLAIETIPIPILNEQITRLHAINVTKRGITPILVQKDQQTHPKTMNLQSYEHF
jgi:hypothetical protein